MLLQKIKSLSTQLYPKYLDIRRHIHANPELSYQEYKTAEFVEKHLQSLGIQTTRKAGTGVIGTIEGRNPGSRTVALRADMDALPIQEENEVDYRSNINGVMHACGHDVHTTCLLGAAEILVQTSENWEGRVKLIFQPGEEKNPGGASLLIKEGVLKDPEPEAIFALHVNPQLEHGRLSFRSGMIMASADEIYITVKGKGGHAAAPHQTSDTILISSQIVIALQQVISRNRNPFSPSVLSITSIQGGNTTNVIPSEVKLMGTFRAMDEEWRYKAHELIKKIATQTAEASGAAAEVHIDNGYPTVYNNETLHPKAKSLAAEYMGEDFVEETEIRMGAEDFGFYSQQLPGCFFRLGTANKEKGITSGVHTPHFNIEETAIETGIGIMAWMGARGGMK